MNHDEAIRLMGTEKYLLDELSPELRDQFEEHFFSCTECALDVRVGAAFIDQSKELLARESVASRVVPVVRAGPGWLAWLRPAFVGPVFAVLLAVIAYQNVITYPRLKLA